MHLKHIPIRRLMGAILIGYSLNLNAQRQTEFLDRGILVVPKNGSEVHISWRHFATDPDEITYNVYYKTSTTGTLVKANTSPIKNSSNFVFNLPSSSSNYIFEINSILNGVEKKEPGDFTLKAGSKSRIVHDFDFKPIEGLPAGTTMPMKFCSVADLNGDGAFDYILDRQNYGAVTEDGDGASIGYPTPKVEAYNSQGAFMWRIDIGPNVMICNGQSDMVTAYDMDGCGKAEVMIATSEGTVFADGSMITGSNGSVTDYRNSLRGAPQYISFINGENGCEVARVEVPFKEFLTKENLFGGNYNNFNGHFAIAYLDGLRPSLIYSFENRNSNKSFNCFIASWDFRNGVASERWKQQHTRGEAGFHQVHIADVDGDGKDKFIQGGYVVDDDGTTRFLAQNIVHGDRHMTADIDPDRPGLETFFIQQNNPKTIGMGLYDASTGEAIKYIYMDNVGDVGRGTCLAADPTLRGLQFWSTMNGSALYNSKGEKIENAYGPFPSEAIWWDGDLCREHLRGVDSNGGNLVVEKYNNSSKNFGRYLSLYNEDNGHGNYYFKGNYGARAAFWGDFLGDWREELICNRSNGTGFVVLATNEETSNRLYSLIQNPAYRMQSTAHGYYQTANVDYYLGYDMPQPPLAPVQQADLYYIGGAWNFSENSFTDGKNEVNYSNDKVAMFDIRGKGGKITLDKTLHPQKVFFMNPSGVDYILEGEGKLIGAMTFVKSLGGDVYLNTSHEYTGDTYISEGRLFVNDSLTSKVIVQAKGVLGGIGVLKNGVILNAGLNQHGGRIEPGTPSVIGKLYINGDLALTERNTLSFDIDPTQEIPSDFIEINGNWTLTGKNHTLEFRFKDKPVPGNYKLLSFTGTTNIKVSSFKIIGLEGTPYTIDIIENTLVLNIRKSRQAGTVIWQGNGNNRWDFNTENFLNDKEVTAFVPNDTVFFDDSAINKSISITETMPVGGLTFDGEGTYTLSGNGIISGEKAKLTKKGNGTLKLLNTENSFTGVVNISGGVLEVASLKDAGQPSSIGAGASSSLNWVMTQTKLRLSGAMSTNRSMRINDSLIIETPLSSNSAVLTGIISAASSVVTFQGAGLVNLQGNNSFKEVILKGGVLQLGSSNGNRNGLGQSKITLIGGTLRMFDVNNTSDVGDFTNGIYLPEGASARWETPSRWASSGPLTGTGTLDVYSPYVRHDFKGDWSAFEGTLRCTGREMRWSNTYGLGKANLVLENSCYFYYNGSSSTQRIGSLASTSSTAVLTGGSGGGSWIIGGNNQSTSYSGTISGNISIIKEGSGTLTLKGNSTSSGNFTITGGVLEIINNGGSTSGTGTGNIAVNSRGTLAGRGNVSGGITINSGAFFDMNDSNTAYFSAGGGFTFKSNSTIKLNINASGSRIDQIRCSTEGKKVTIAGNLELIKLGTVAFTAGQTFKLIDATQISGNFANISPAPGDDLIWSQERLESEGILEIIERPNGVSKELIKAVTITPNPVEDIATISLPNELEEVEVNILSYNGALLHQQKCTNNTQLQLGHLAAGVYSVTITQNGQHIKQISIIIK